MNKKSIVPFIKTQLPRYISDSDSLFPDFIEAYYEWLNLDGNTQAQIYKLENINDVDKSLQDFYDEFIYEYIDNIPETILIDKSTLIKKVSDLYASKGTPKAVKFLLRILYNIDSDVFFPSTQIFKSSDAKWVRDLSVRFVITDGFLSSFSDVPCNIILSNGVEIDTLALNISRVNNSLNEFEAILDIDYKLQIDPSLSATIQSNTFTGTLVKSITSKNILAGGKGFSLGDIYNIDINGASGLKIKVTRTGKDGKLLACQIIDFGANYTEEFESIILSYFYRNEVDVDIELELNDNISQIQENVIVSKYDYTEDLDYFEDNTYVGELLVNSTESTISDGSTIDNISDNVAVINFSLGYVMEYPGYHITNVGFPSDASYLQDGEYFQQFSYVIKSIEQYDKYKQTLLNTVHVAGLKPFGEYSIQSYLDILIDIENELSLLDINFSETASINDELVKIYIKNIQESINILETIAITLNKPMSITTSVSDIAFKTVNKSISETISLAETVLKGITKDIQEEVSISDINIRITDKVVTEQITLAESACAFVNDPYFDISEGLYWECGYTDTEVLISG